MKIVKTILFVMAMLAFLASCSVAAELRGGEEDNDVAHRKLQRNIFRRGRMGVGRRHRRRRRRRRRQRMRRRRMRMRMRIGFAGAKVPTAPAPIPFSGSVPMPVASPVFRPLSPTRPTGPAPSRPTPPFDFGFTASGPCFGIGCN